jgi:hypothetical protein
VPQRLHIDPTLPITVERFLRLTGRVHAGTCRGAGRRRRAGPRPRQMSQLSGGQFQRVLLARALINKPDVLLLDEATQGLDQPGSAAFYRQIEQVRAETGCAVLMISHELHVVMSASDRVICLNGHVCCEGTPAVVASAPEYRALFGTGTGGALALYRHTTTITIMTTTRTTMRPPNNAGRFHDPRHAGGVGVASPRRRWAVSSSGGGWPISATPPPMRRSWASRCRWRCRCRSSRARWPWRW